MTNNKFLDAILASYLFNEKLRHTHPHESKKLTFEFIAKAQLPEVEDWRIEFLRKQLISDGFLEYAEFGDGVTYTLTPTGIKAAQLNWYSKNEEETQLDKDIKKQTLLSLKRSKDAKTISIWAIIVPTLISIGTFIYVVIKNEKQSNIKQVQQFKQQVDTIRLKQLKQQRTLDSLQSASPDTSQKVMSDK